MEETGVGGDVHVKKKAQQFLVKLNSTATLQLSKPTPRYSPVRNEGCVYQQTGGRIISTAYLL